MAIPFVDLKSQYNSIKEEVDKAISDIISNTAFIGGKAVNEFEEKFAELHDTDYCISCANGTDAIYIALRSLGIGPGDEVIVPANTWISTSETVSQTGATPIFVDIDEFFHIDPSKIQEKITNKTKAIIPVHLYGQPCDIKQIVKIATENKLYVIEDCAQAHLAEIDGQKVGTFGDLATFSFYPGKNLGAYGDAGAIITEHDEYANYARKFKNHGSEVKHIHEFEGINSRMDGIQAAVLNVKMKYINDWTDLRIRNASYYDVELFGIEGIQLPLVRENAKHVYHLYVIKIQNRKEIMRKLGDHNIGHGLHYPTALPFMSAYDSFKYQPEDFPIAFEDQNRILSLPMFPELTLEDVRKVKEVIVS